MFTILGGQGQGPRSSHCLCRERSALLGVFEDVGSNLDGHYINWSLLKSGDPRDIIPDVKSHLAKHKYMYMSCTSDQARGRIGCRPQRQQEP